MNGYVSNFIFGTALNVVHPGIPNVLEADLARVSMVGPLLLALAVAVLLLCAFVVERILRTLSMLPPLCRLSIGQAMICLSARSVTERERERELRPSLLPLQVSQERRHDACLSPAPSSQPLTS